jgi:hypothetical protein
MTRPHSYVYCRLAPSPLHGVGVFAICDIPQNMHLFGEDVTGLDEVSITEVANLPAYQSQLYKDFAILENDTWVCPKSFNDMTIAWYINHSKTPNVVMDGDYIFWSAKDIKAGEELTVDYATYSDYTGVDDVANALKGEESGYLGPEKSTQELHKLLNKKD